MPEPNDTAPLIRRRHIPQAQNQSSPFPNIGIRSSTKSGGWPIDLVAVFEEIYYILIVGFDTLYSAFFQGGNELVMGILRYLGGKSGENEVEMDEKVVEGDIKPRRRVEKGGSDGNGAHYPGMVNLSGTLCYMNSVLQSFASIPSLVIHLERNIALAVELDVPTPVADTLLDVIQDLNTPYSRPRRPIRPAALLTALSTLPTIQRLLGTREQQDAHELFLVLAEAISVESLKVAGEVAKSRGMGEVLDLQKWAAGKVNTMKGRADAEGANRNRKRQRGLAQPWEGLMARRRICRVCGWCEAVRMEPVGGMELPLPQNGDVSLDACIKQYLAPELLTGVTCEMCSLQRTHSHYQGEFDRLSNPSSNPPTKSKPIREGSGSFGALDNLSTLPSTSDPSTALTEMTPARRKRAKEAKRLVTRLQDMITSGTVSNFGESLLPPSVAGPSTTPIPIKWQTVNTDSIRSALITRPPQTLRLHLIRSEYTPYGVLLKKSARVDYPVILDLTRFVTRGVWEERTGVLGALASGEKVEIQKKVLYRLESVILHYGYTHSSGHYICIRRKPSKGGNQGGEEVRRPIQVNKSCEDGCNCQDCIYYGQVRDGGNGPIPGKGWLRVSDDEVEEVGEEALVASRSQVFMLFYERVGEYVGSSSGGSGKKGVESEKESVDDDYGRGRKTPDDDQVLGRAHL